MIGRIGPIELIILIVVMLMGGIIPIGGLVMSILIYLKVKKIEDILEEQK